MGASWNGQLDTVSTLLEYGAEVGAQTNVRKNKMMMMMFMTI
jgi:hypothetical protein